MLNARAIGKGALLLSLGTGLAAVIKFISIPVLARLLTPTEFGIAGSALVLVSFAAILSGGAGLGTAVTHFKDSRDEYDHVVVWAAALIGIAVGALVWSFSGTLTQAWGTSEAAPYIRIVALFFPFSVLAGVGYALLARDLRFQAIATINITASVLSTLTAIFMASKEMGSWSLIGQYCVFNVMKCFSFGIVSGYKPKLKVTKRGVREVFPFAYRLTLAQALIWISSEGPFVLVTSTFGVMLGGVYRLFQRFTALPREIIGENIARAGYVGMAGSTNSGALAGFFWFSKVTNYLQGAVFIWLATMAEPLTALLLGAQYERYWPLATALSGGLAAQSLSSMTIPFLKARGRTDIVLWLSVFRTAMILAGAWLGVQLFGTLIAVAIAIALAMAMASLMFLTCITALEKLCLRQLAAATLVPVLLGSLGAGLVYFIDTQVSDQISNLSRVFLGTVIGAGFYALLIRVFAPKDFGVITSKLQRRAKKW